MTRAMKRLRSNLPWAALAGALVLIVGLTSTVLAQSQSSDATLSGLTLSNVDFGTFASGTTSYTASVASTVTQTTVTPTTTHSEATYVIKRDLDTDADGEIGLRSGCNNISVEVTAEDGQTTQTYTVAVTVLDASYANLCDLKMSGLNIEDWTTDEAFRPRSLSYDADTVPFETSETTVTYSLGDPEASVVVTSENGTYADGIVPLDVGGFTNIMVSVTSEDGQTTTTYSVLVVRFPGSGVASLGRLSLSDVKFDRSFHRNRVSYTASEHEGVAHSTTETTVTALADHTDASYVIKLDGVEDDDGVIPLAVGDNVITVEVTAQNGTSTRTYTVTVKRPATVSTNARLYKLVLSDVNIGLGVGRGAYNQAAYLPWEGTVGPSVSETTVTPEPWHIGSSYIVKIGDVEYSDHTVPLAIGINTITIEVTAEDGVTTESYTATVTRSAANSPATGAPTISGTAQVGQTLTANMASSIFDADGLSAPGYSYQWLADDTNIDGATGRSYTVQSSDNGKVIKVRVTFTDDAGNEEMLTSAGTSAVVLGGL